MKKNITVIIETKSKKQDPCKNIKKVSMGYAFNYLIPKKIARVATKGEIKHLQMLQEIVSNNQHAIYSQKTKIQRKLKKIDTILVRKQCSPNQLIFGSISEQDIAKKILQLTGQTINKNQVKLSYSKKLGKYNAEVVFDEKVKTSISLYIISKNI